MRKICVVTGTRAEYGLLYWVMKEIEKSKSLKLQVLVTGMHLSEEFGSTYKTIEADGFKIDEKVSILSGEDTALATAQATGRGLSLFAESFTRLKPDLIMLLGDRFELLAAASAALFLKIPVAHLSGGDTTEGAFDESIRHSITKMSHLHFVTNELAAKRVRQLGENPGNIFNVGNPGLEHIIKTRLLSRAELQAELGMNLKENLLTVTFHPVTLEENTESEQISELLKALEVLLQDGKTSIVFTKSNSDTNNKAINDSLTAFVQNHAGTKLFSSLGSRLYLSLLANSKMVIGNSSSGLIEAPSFKIPTVNIGDRQKGRLSAASVIDCAPKADQILAAVKKAAGLDCSRVVNPYGKADSSVQICKILESQSDYKKLIKKHFYEL